MTKSIPKGSEMKRIYHHYKYWEDYHAGMYECANMIEGHELVGAAAKLLSSRDQFYRAAKEMITAWPYASEHNLTNTDTNRKSWIGQATCCHRYGCPMDLTIIGWRELTDEQRASANAIATQVIKEYETELINKSCLKLNLE
mgnify:CR=1 FL=1|jgi:hypothetical protein